MTRATRPAAAYTGTYRGGWTARCPVCAVPLAARTKRSAERWYREHWRAEHKPAPRPRIGTPKRMEVTPGVTLAEARTWLRGVVEEGATCPCCSQLAKVYQRSIHASMTAMLLRFYRHFDLGWGKRPAFFGGGAEGDFAKLRYWGLVEESVETRQDGGRAGWWRVTERGAAFARGEARVPRYALIFDGRCLALDGPTIDVHDALGTRFSYNELMGRPL